MIGNYCREYRLKHGVTLKQLAGDKIGTISAFENGRSSNIEHLKLYMQLSIVMNDSPNFINGLSLELSK